MTGVVVPRCSGCRRVVPVGALACRDCLDRLPAALRAALAQHRSGTGYLAAEGHRWRRDDDDGAWMWRVQPPAEGDALTWSLLLDMFGPLRELSEPITRDDPPEAEVPEVDVRVTRLRVTEGSVTGLLDRVGDGDRWEFSCKGLRYSFTAPDHVDAGRYAAVVVAAVVARDDALQAAHQALETALQTAATVQGVSDVRNDEPPF